MLAFPQVRLLNKRKKINGKAVFLELNGKADGEVIRSDGLPCFMSRCYRSICTSYRHGRTQRVGRVGHGPPRILRNSLATHSVCVSLLLLVVHEWNCNPCVSRFVSGQEGNWKKRHNSSGCPAQNRTAKGNSVFFLLLWYWQLCIGTAQFL